MYTKDEAYQKIEELTIRFSEQIQSNKNFDCNKSLFHYYVIVPFCKTLS